MVGLIWWIFAIFQATKLIFMPIFHFTVNLKQEQKEYFHKFLKMINFCWMADNYHMVSRFFRHCGNMQILTSKTFTSVIKL